ncbi:MAG: HDIG domain-containing protein [Syntrophomonadaceae bacterium]|jgi:putative nucleotidyltransferase with HDIG domain|nr:HDIG domain-containing protein [Syntrophomonadaceae bacterium]
MDRNEALELLKKHVKSQNLINHSLAVEAIMRGLARHLQEDEESFGLAGLLHDIDYDQTADDPMRHSAIGAEMLAQMGLPEELCYAVKAHNDAHGLPRRTLLDHALYAADPASGFITAAALIRPDKQLSAVEMKSLRKRFKEKSFARGASREQMATCSELGMDLDTFLEIALQSMKKIAGEIGL